MEVFLKKLLQQALTAILIPFALQVLDDLTSYLNRHMKTFMEKQS